MTIREHCPAEVHIARAPDLCQSEPSEGKRLGNWLIIYAPETSMGKQEKQDTGPSIFICISHSRLCPLQKADDCTEFGLYASKCMIYNKLGFL